jgi:acyl-CoA synthetase (NDP forming)
MKEKEASSPKYLARAETITNLQEKLPDYAIPHNPLDLVGDADVERYRMALNVVSSDPNVGIILVIVLL